METDILTENEPIVAAVCSTPTEYLETTTVNAPKKSSRKRKSTEYADPFSLNHECLTSHQLVQVEKVLNSLVGQAELQCDEVLQCMTSIVDQIVAKRIRYRSVPKEKVPHLSRKELANMFCYCGYGDGHMIGCEGDKCPGNNWYHLECVGLRTEPRGVWYCQSCAERKASKEKEQKVKSLRCSKRSRKETSSYKIDDTKFVVTQQEKAKKTINPLRVEAAERQSREEMDAISAKSKCLNFTKIGKVVLDEKSEDFPHDLCKFKLPDDDFQALQSLHRLIVKSLNSNAILTPWAGVGESDQRKRGYAFLPHSYGKFGKTALQSLGVNFHAAEKRGSAAKNDENANWKSCYRLKESDLIPEYLHALNTVIKIVKKLVPSKYQHVIALDHLHALQPNLHNGLDHLPAHIDSPLNDGFGIVIVTICVHQNADILMLSNKSNKSWVFNVQEGETYVLSGDARNIYDHGVICPLEKRTRKSAMEQDLPKKKTRRKKGDPENIGRESLNLRFGIHGIKPGSALYYLDEMPENVLID